MLLKLFCSAAPAVFFGWFMWDVITLCEKINQLQRENHRRKNLMKEIEEELQRFQDDIKDNRKEIGEVFRRVN